MKHKRLWLILPLVILLLGGLFTVLDARIGLFSSREPNDHIALPATPFTLKDTNGKDTKLESFKNKLVLLHFWGSWCPPCLEELPDLIEFAKTVSDTELKVLAVAVDKDWDVVKKITGPFDQLPPNFILLLDTDGKIANQYGSYEFPESYFVTRDQKIMMKWIGPQNWKSPELIQALKAKAK